jgi:hypothetical protein
MLKRFGYFSVMLLLISAYAEAQELTADSGKLYFIKSKVIHGDTVPHLNLKIRGIASDIAG